MQAGAFDGRVLGAGVLVLIVAEAIAARARGGVVGIGTGGRAHRTPGATLDLVGRLVGRRAVGGGWLERGGVA